MREVSDLWREIVAGDYEVETILKIGEAGEESNVKMQQLFYVKTNRRLFEGESLCVGSCVAGEIEAKLFAPSFGIPRNARLRPYVRVYQTGNQSNCSEWIQKGDFWVDQRKNRNLKDGRQVITLSGYDAMLRAEDDFGWDVIQKWPATDIDVVKAIAKQMKVSLDPRAEAIISKGYRIQVPEGYSCREILGYIAAMYCGNFVMSDIGQLLLVQLNNVSRESIVLANERGIPILFGGEPIRV